MSSSLYVHYGKDGLIDAIGDTRKELAALIGSTANSVASSISHKSPRFFRLEYEDEWLEEVRKEERTEK